jgi:apolipoprotein N-acyltransferase
VLAPNWGLATVIRRVIVRRREGRQFSLADGFREIGPRRFAPLFLVPVVVSTYGLARIVSIDRAVHEAKTSRIGIVQANISLTDKVNDTQGALQKHIQLTRKLIRTEKIDLAVWPETAIGGAVHVDDAAQSYRRNVTQRLGVPAIIGAILWQPVDDVRERVLFNSALISGHEGRIIGRYDKQWLLLFGEYLPLGERFPVLYEWSPNSGRFSQGTTYDPLPFNEHQIATFICYEDLDADFVNKLMKHGSPELLVNMTNDAWFGDTSEPWEHMALSQMRAVEQRRFMVRSTNSGVSGFVDPVGRLVKHTGTFKAEAIAHDVAWLNIRTPFQIWGNLPWKILSWIIMGMAFVRRPASFGRRAPVDG